MTDIGPRVLAVIADLERRVRDVAERARNTDDARRRSQLEARLLKLEIAARRALISDDDHECEQMRVTDCATPECTRPNGHVGACRTAMGSVCQ